MEDIDLTEQLADRMPLTANAIGNGIDLGWHPGAQACVWHDGGIVANAGAGTTDGSNPMESDSVNLWLSAGKPIGAVAAMLLVEDGLIELDQPVAAYWPEFGANGKDTITTRHLLTHTAGIRTAEIAASMTDLQEVIAVLENTRIERDWQPGKRAAYHATSGWQALGELVRRVSGSDYDEFVAKRVFLPLEMSSSLFRLTAEEAESLGARFSPMHMIKNGVYEEEVLYTREFTSSFARPGSGLRSTASDMVRFYRMLMGIGELDGTRLLEPEDAAEITSPQRIGMKDETFGQVMDWGLGVMFDNKVHGPAAPYSYGPYASARTFGHGGRESSTAFADPEHELAVALVFNAMPGEVAHDRRLRMVTAAIYEDLELAR